MKTAPASTSPSLLVSVRSLTEAQRICHSSCAIVDVKEPANGPLGRASFEVQQDIARACSDRVVSLALGEVVDWQPIDIPRVDYLKLGPAGLRSDRKWLDRWRRVRAEADAVTGHSAGWVAVSYGDYEQADAPAPAEILDAAIETGCAVLLLDTFDKSSGRCIFDCLTVTEIIELRTAARRAGLRFAIAGQLRSHHADLIREVEADIVGIRGAACIGAARQNEISPVAASRFATAIGARTQPPRF